MAKDTSIQSATNDRSAEGFRNYAALLRQIRQRVLLAQQRAIYAANEEMLRMYWDIGKMLQQSQQADGWGRKTLQRLSVDLKNDYPEIKGFSVRNMQCMMQFFDEYNQELTMVKGAASTITQSMIAQLEKSSAPITQPVIASLEEYNFTPSHQAFGMDAQPYTHATSQGHTRPILVHGTKHRIPLENTLFTRSYPA